MLSNLALPPAALTLQRHLARTSNETSKALEKLSSGQRINRAADDAATLSITEKLRAQISGLAMANRNIQDGLSMLRTADGALQETTNVLQRMRELAVQNASATWKKSDRNASNAEFLELKNEINAIANHTQFNNQQLIAANKNVTLQVGADRRQTQRVTFKRMNAAGLGISGSGVNISTAARASTAIKSLDTALERVTSFRASLGAQSSLLEHALNLNAVAGETHAATFSRLRDVDAASEASRLTRSLVQQQAGTALLSQANSAAYSLPALLNPQLAPRPLS